MSTTDLFVELIVVGMGAAIWMCLLVLSLFGWAWIPAQEALSLGALIPILPAVYVLGIVIDRIADSVFDRLWRPSLFAKVYERQEQYFYDRRCLYVHPGRLASLLEYGRSRLRICRGWTLNCLLILIGLNVFAWTRVVDRAIRINLSVFGSLAVALFGFGCWFSWRQLALVYYRKIRARAAFLRELTRVEGEEVQL